MLCEKPLAATPAAALRVVEAEAALGRRLVQVGFMRRYDPGYAELKRELAAGTIGAPVLVHCVHRNPAVAPTFTSEMIITDTVVHEIDCVRWLLDQELVRATVYAGRSSARVRAGTARSPVRGARDRGRRRRRRRGVRDGALRLRHPLRARGRVGHARAGADGRGGRAPRRRGGGFACPPATRSASRPPTCASCRGSWRGSPRATGVSGASAWDGYAATVACEAAVASLHRGEAVDIRLAERPALYAAELTPAR